MTIMETSAAGFPVPHNKLSIDVKKSVTLDSNHSRKELVKGIKTDLFICVYEDHFLVIITQIGSMGTLLQARKEESVSIHPTFNVSVIFGKRDEPMLLACARQLIENISASGSPKSLVLSLGLKDHSEDALKAVVSVVVENRLW